MNEPMKTVKEMVQNHALWGDTLKFEGNDRTGLNDNQFVIDEQPLREFADEVMQGRRTEFGVRCHTETTGRFVVYGVVVAAESPIDGAFVMTIATGIYRWRVNLDYRPGARPIVTRL